MRLAPLLKDIQQSHIIVALGSACPPALAVVNAWRQDLIEPHTLIGGTAVLSTFVVPGVYWLRQKDKAALGRFLKEHVPPAFASSAIATISLCLAMQQHWVNTAHPDGDLANHYLQASAVALGTIAGCLVTKAQAAIGRG